MENVEKILHDNGILIIEVEYLKSMLDHLEFERFYFDRPFYYSLKSISEISKRCGMELYDVKEIKPHGGSLRVYIKKKIGNHKISRVVEETLNNEKNTLDLFFIREKFNIFNKEIETLRNTLKQFKDKGLKIIGYGAPARLATITNYGEINENLISSIVDDSPLKVNRYSPGKHIPIRSFESILESNFDIIILFAYEYFESIKLKFLPNIPEFYKPVPLQKLNKDNQ